MAGFNGSESIGHIQSLGSCGKYNKLAGINGPGRGWTLSGVLSYLVLGYAVFLLFFYPYGVKLIGSRAFRFPDIVLLPLLVLGVSFILYRGEFRFKYGSLLVLLPLLVLELLLPALGAVYHGDLSNLFSGVRIFILYLPLILYGFYINIEDFSLLDQKMERILIFAVTANVIYSFVQMLTAAGFLPEQLLITRLLAGYAVDDFYDLQDGLRASGFFINSTRLSIFGVISMSYLLARYRKYQEKRHLIYGLGGFMLVILSNSRIAYLAGFLILYVIALASDSKLVGKLLKVLGSLFLLLITALNLTVGVEKYFYRFFRLTEGLFNDYSLGYRLRIWPEVLAEARDYPLGTLGLPTDFVGLIDSGYLSYYIQGKWLFVGALVFFLAGLLMLALKATGKRDGLSGLFLLGLFIYLALAMITTNPLHTPQLIFFLMYGLMLHEYEKKIPDEEPDYV